MQTKNLQLSNIILKEQHYLPQPNIKQFHFQLQPITHKLQSIDDQFNEIKFINKDVNARRQKLEKAQKIRKQLLLQKIANKNYKYQLRQKAQKQKENKINTEINHSSSQNINKLYKNQRSLNNQFIVKQKDQKLSQDNNTNNKVKKIYANAKNQIQFSSTKGFVRHQDEELIRRIMGENNKVGVVGDNRINKNNFKGLRLQRVNNVKLPQLNYANNNKIAKQTQNNNKLEQKQTVQVDPNNKRNKKQKSNKQFISLPTSLQPLNPILKVTDVRYFGIEQREEDYEKEGRNLLKLIKRKYWCYDSLQNEQIYENFQNLLNQQFM